MAARPRKPSPAAPPSTSTLPAWLPALALAAATLLAYLPALRAGFIWDDDYYVTRNWTLRSLAGLGAIWTRPGAVPQYYPLTFTSLWLDFRLWGVEPFGYHLVNVLLHVGNALLVGRILGLLSVPGAWIGATLFALHPVHVESVAWITERKNVLSGTFTLAALVFYLRFAGLAGKGGGSWRVYLVALGLFAGAMLSKTVACTLPVVILVLLWWRRGRVGWDDLVPLVPFFALGGALALVTIWMETHHVGARGVDWQLSPLARVLIAGRALWFYLGKLAWPWPLVFNYPRWEVDTGVWWQHLFPLAAIALAVGLFAARNRIGRGPLAAALVFAATLFPALGFVDVFPMRYSFVADHFQYLASLGPLALAAAGLYVLARRVEPRAALAAGGAGALGLGALVTTQAHAYRDLRSLWTDTLAKNPGSWMAHNNLGLLLQDEGRLDEAMVHYRSALSAKPDDAFAHNNLGYVLVMQGRPEEAEAEFEAALRIEPHNTEAHNNFGNLLVSRGRVDEAIVHYREAVRLRPGYAEAHNNLAGALAMQGRTDEALAGVQTALRIDPGYADAHHNLGAMLADAGRLEQAVVEYEAALRLKPRFAQAHANLGLALARLNRAADALAHFAEAVRLDPGNAVAAEALAQARARRPAPGGAPAP